MPIEIHLGDNSFNGLPLDERSMESYSHAVRQLIPQDIMAQAEQIVASHKTEGVPSESEPVCLAGLKPKHHGELNKTALVYPGGEKAYNQRVEQLRSEYAGDKVALQQIDVYDGRTEYHDKLQEFIQAIKSKDSKKEAELQAWFDKNYPDIH